ncbi:thioesterase [Niabella ginsenosidivorans]|uniref:Thioesterase n=1 Tax=Niabella ginsenosidivorans TaxID=1176587 RepID=A0A1A9I3A1_9BACT|nr:thioesterase family protein [Niabella ginsenosidivorans]ANH82148.1 thioesterase [Niabella ginsenosidivorans]
MARIKIALPKTFRFTCTIPVRVTDINYGGHAGNDSLLGMIQEARVQFLKQFNYTELSFEGIGLIMADVAMEFKNEAFMGDLLLASVAAGDFQRVGFDLYYRLEKEVEGKKIPVVFAKTGMICFDYTLRKSVALPEAALQKLQ